MTRPWLLVAALTALMPAIAVAQDAKPASGATDVAHAQKIVSDVCAACHGSDGNSPTPANPNLAGQPADYITLQLMQFKTGIRKSPIMQPMASTLSDSDMQALGAYFAKQTPRGLVAHDAKTVKMAQALYRGGNADADVPACAACHGPAGAGVPKNYPRLGGQHSDYVYAQLKAFKAGERGGDSGKDPNGAIMATIASRLSDAEMKAVADYVQGLR
jgi:cytochrome c553